MDVCTIDSHKKEQAIRIRLSNDAGWIGVRLAEIDAALIENDEADLVANVLELFAAFLKQRRRIPGAQAAQSPATGKQAI